MTSEPPEWQRLVQEPDELEEDEGAFVEVVRVGCVVYERTGRIDGLERFGKRVLATESSAQKSLDRQVANLTKDGYAPDDPVRRALPELPDARGERERLHEAARQKLESCFGAFVEEYEKAGFDPAKTFLAACVGKNVHPNVVASTCLAIVSTLFGVGFSRCTRTYDPEHGMRMSIPERLLAEFYDSPAFVIALTRQKLAGHNGSDDDLDAPGLSDEIQARFVTTKA